MSRPKNTGLGARNPEDYPGLTAKEVARANDSYLRGYRDALTRQENQ